VGDGLGFALLQLSGGSAGASAAAGSGASAGASTPGRLNGSSHGFSPQLVSSQGGPPVVLTAVLGVFESLLHVAGPALRILVEGFARQVFLRALMQTYTLFIEQVRCSPQRCARGGCI
jgi:hypothetical protein